jgi:hypothetical protein
MALHGIQRGSVWTKDSLTYGCFAPQTLTNWNAPNKSFDRSGGGVFRIKRGAAKVEWNRAARSTQALGRLLT